MMNNKETHMTNNEMYKSLFQNFDKAEAFDELAELFYNRNFATASKSEIELLMFNFYLNATIDFYKNEQNVLDYTKASDYQMAKQLGITQEKVRNLKVKKQARYPVEFKWQESLESIKDNIRLDGKRIIIPVSDPNLRIEIKNFINENGGFVDVESGKDYLRVRIEYYLMLMYYTLDIENQKKFCKAIKKQLKKNNGNEDIFDDTNKIELANSMLSLANSGFEIVNNVISTLNPQNTLVSILSKVINVTLNLKK